MKIFCSLPFKKVFLGPDGGVKTCCAAIHTIGNLNENTIDEILHGDEVKGVRDKFINNEWPAQCRNCKDVGTNINVDATEMSYNDDIYDNAIKHGSSYFDLKTIDLRWSNLCNLVCNYCEPYFSSRWAQIKNIKINDTRNMDTLLDFIGVSAKKSKIEHVQLLGGEPLLQKQNIELIERIKDNSLLIAISTNLSIPLENNKIAQLLLKHENVHWNISMDNIGKRLEYVRDGASWEILSNNIKYLQDNNQQVKIWPIYSIYSATNMIELYDWAINNGVLDVKWQVVSPGGPYPIYVKNLSKELKFMAINEIDTVMEKYGSIYEMTRLQTYKDSMLLKYLDSTDLLDYKEYHLDLEQNVLKNKQHTFAELWPDL
jgi:MoaA/NifB/PqqE/SkfB family radical SAM enzyme